MLHAGHSIYARTFAAAALLSAGVLAGCKDSAPTAARADDLDVQLAINGVSGESVVIDPRNATLQVGYGAVVQARILDAAGNPISGVRPTWASSNPLVATVTVLPDSGRGTDGLRAAVSARAAGVALIIVSRGDKADTARFTVTARDSVPPDSIPGGQGPVTRPSRFDVIALVSQNWIDSLVLRPDSNWVAPPIAGATVRFVQLPSMPGDTLTPNVPPVTAPVVLATAVSDSNGAVSFRDMPATRYRLEVETPATSEWGSRVFTYGAPFKTPMLHQLRLIKKIYQ